MKDLMKWRGLLLFMAVLWSAHVAAAQNVTTGTLGGVVKDAQGGVLPGATVVAVHTPTGTTYEGVTQTDGRFSILNVRVGGPYSLTITMPGFRTETIGDVSVALGEASEVPITLQLETFTETVQVTSAASQVFTASRTGATDTVDRAVIENLPTISRSLQDFARTNPFFVQTATNANPGNFLSVAGRSGRYNNVQIDGAVNNDLFGLSETGTPGGPANTEPISLDAIQELQLVVSAADVRQSGFSGGGVNAITRSGTNRFRGTGYFFSRDQDLVGNGVDDRPIATFSDRQGGGSFGGPIRQNRAFFFGNGESQRRKTPSGYSVTGSSGQAFGRSAEAQRIVDIARTRYGYTVPGGLDEFIRENPNDKFFARVDVNLGRHQLAIRHNYIKAYNDVGTQSNTTYLFADQFYGFNSRTNSTVGQLNSTFGASVNEFRVTAQRIRDFRSNRGEPFPHVVVRLADGGRFRLGTEQFSARNELDQDNIELHDDFTWVRGKHQFTFGTHNEFFKFRNLFIRDNFGFYDFNSIDLFEQGLAQDYSYSFSATSDPLQSARFWVYQLGFYAGDQWRLNDRVTMTYGARLDKPIFPDTPAANPLVEQLYGFRTDVTPSTLTFSPRVGVNVDLSSDSTRQQLRGTLGVYGGRTPYVWLSNQYTSTGNEFIRISTGFNVNNRVPFSSDPNNQPRNVGPAATNEINLIDPDYDYPQLFRGSLGYDRDLGFWNLIGTVEMLFSETLKDIDYKNLNLRQAGTRPDGRPFYARANSAFSDVILLTNTDQGNSWTLATTLKKRFSDNWQFQGSYLYGQSETINDGGSSQARSNWVNTYNLGDPNNIPLATSNFDPGHRITLSGAYQIPVSRVNVTLSAFYNGQQGRPYGYTFGNDVNVDGGSMNDLLYIPANNTDVIVNNATFDDLMRFLNTDCEVEPGSINPRSICRSPWTNTFDFRAALDLPFGKTQTQITFDLLNLLNVFDSSDGLVDYAVFNQLLPVNFAIDAATGKYIYNVNDIARPGRVRYSRDDLRSRWQAQLGVRFSWAQ
jgi:Carboxypeptidase regulatory-like domain